MSRMIEIPDWCIIGKWIWWKSPYFTGFDWVRERIIGYSDDGFFHQGPNCPVYHSKFSEFDNTVRLEKPNSDLHKELS